MLAASGGHARCYPAKEGVTVVVRADSAARKRSGPSSGQDTRAPADRHGSGPTAVNGRGNGDGAQVPGADLPGGEVAVVDLDEADGLSDGLDEGVDVENFDELSVEDVEIDVEISAVELDEADGTDEPGADDDAEGPEDAAADEAQDDGPDTVVAAAAVRPGPPPPRPSQPPRVVKATTRPSSSVTTTTICRPRRSRWPVPPPTRSRTT